MNTFEPKFLVFVVTGVPILPLAQRVRWHEDRAGQASQGVRAGKLSLEAAGS